MENIHVKVIPYFWYVEKYILGLEETLSKWKGMDKNMKKPNNLPQKKPHALPPGDLKNIPGVGANMAQHLEHIGIHCIEDLRGRDPEELYHLDTIKKGFQDDRCVLYVYRCAVYYAEHEEHDPEKLKWWYWKDKAYPEEG